MLILNNKELFVNVQINFNESVIATCLRKKKEKNWAIESKEMIENKLYVFNLIKKQCHA